MSEISETITDEKLVFFYKQGSQDAFNTLLKNYTPMIYIYCSRYFAKGLERVDLFQEGCIGLYVAVTRFRGNKGRFKAFAKAHIKNYIINAVKTATRKKQQFLNHYKSFFSEIEHNNSDGSCFMDILASSAPTPEEIHLKNEETKEKQRDLNQFLRTMTQIEQLVFMEMMNGKTYREAADKIGLSSKSIDNAISRIKKKAKKSKLNPALKEAEPISFSGSRLNLHKECIS